MRLHGRLILQKWYDRSIFFTLAIALFVGISPTAQGGTTGDRELIRGRVIDGRSEQPLAGVMVTVRARGEPIPVARTVTDALGRFSISASRLLRHVTVVAAREGYAGGFSGQLSAQDAPLELDLSRSQSGDDLTLRLWRLGSVSGVVRTNKGQPAIGAAVSALKVTYVGGYPMLSRTGFARTDDRGVYRLFHLQSGEYLVALAAPDPVEEEREIERRRRAAVDRPVVREIPPGKVSSSVSSGSSSQSYSWFYPGTASPGQATLVNVESGDDIAAVDFSSDLGARYSVAGMVRSDVLPLSMRIRLQARDDPYGLDIASVVAGRDGAFVFDNVAPGRYSVFVLEYPEGATKAGTQSPAGYRSSASRGTPTSRSTLWASVPLDVVDGPIGGLDIQLRPAAAVSGRLIADGLGALLSPGEYTEWAISVNTVGAWRLGQLPLTRVSADGSFQTVGLPSGTYAFGAFRLNGSGSGERWHVERLTVHGSNHVDNLVTVGEDDTDGVEIVLSKIVREVAGTVVDASGRPSPGVRVYLFAAERRYWGVPGAPRMFETVSGPDGRYLLRGVPSGDYRVVAVQGPIPGWRQRKTLETLEPKGVTLSVASAATTQRDLRVAIWR